MKALTLWQPWATLIALGHKTIETRGWATRFRGPIAIHAAKRFGRTEQLMCDTWPFNQVLKAEQKFPLGAIVATATLTDCIQIGVDTGSERYQGFEARLEERPYERAFGDYAVGRWAWRLRDITPRMTPVRVRGAQGLWEWEESREPSGRGQSLVRLCDLVAQNPHWALKEVAIGLYRLMSTRSTEEDLIVVIGPDESIRYECRHWRKAETSFELLETLLR